MAAAVGSGGPYWPDSPHLGVVKMMRIIVIFITINILVIHDYRYDYYTHILACLPPSENGKDEDYHDCHYSGYDDSAGPPRRI